MADSDGGHIWFPRASDPRIQELTGAGYNESTPDDVFVKLGELGFTGSIDDRWQKYKIANGITDTSEPYTSSGGGSYISYVGAGDVNFYDNVSGSPLTNLSKPADYAAGDTLMVFHTSFAGAIGPETGSGTWTSVYTVPGGAMGIWVRTATGDSGDDYVITARAPNTGGYCRTVQMAAFRTQGGETLTYLHENTLNTTPSTSFQVKSLTVGPDSENTLVIGAFHRYTNPWGDVTGDWSISDPTLEFPDTSGVIGVHKNFFTLTDTKPYVTLGGWTYTFQSTSSAMAAMDVPFTKVTSIENRTLFFRWGLTP